MQWNYRHDKKYFKKNKQTVLTKTILTKRNLKNLYILLSYPLITIALFIAVSIYYYLKKSSKAKTFITILRYQQNKINWHQKCIIKTENNNKLKETGIKNRTCSIG